MKFYGQFELDKVIYENFYKNRKDPGFFVESGASDGKTENTCLFFEETLGWRGLNIEPVPYLYNLLTKNRSNSTNINGALSNVEGVKKFKNAIHPTLGRNFGNGSLNHFKVHLEELKRKKCSFEDFDVKCFRFKDIYKTYNLVDIDLFVLDVEGHEFMALEGMFPEVKPKLMCIEHSFVGIDRLSKYMTTNGYDLKLVHRHNAIYEILF